MMYLPPHPQPIILKLSAAELKLGVSRSDWHKWTVKAILAQTKSRSVNMCLQGRHSE